MQRRVVQSVNHKPTGTPGGPNPPADPTPDAAPRGLPLQPPVPHSDSLMERMRRADPDLAKRYRQRSGQ